MRLALISDVVTGMFPQAIGLTTKGHSVGILVPETLCPVRPVNLSVTCFPLPSLPDIFHKNTRIITSFPARIPSLLDKFRPDIVHFENPRIHLFYPVYLWCKIHHKPLLTSAFGSAPSFINKILYTMSDLTFDPAGKNPYAQTLESLLHP